MTIKKMIFGNTPSLAYGPGEVLHGFDSEAPEVSGDAYRSPRALALFEALNSTPHDDELVLGVLPDGRWALVGCEGEGHPFAIEDARN